MAKKAYLVLEDGSVFEGRAFGSEQESFGEVVFNTGMTGYQEALTDPSYRGQILTLTYPLIGNYGINKKDFESKEIQVRGFVVSEQCDEFSHHDGEKTVDEFLKEYNITGIAEVDTRALTRVIRNYGTMRGMICFDKKVLEKIKATPFPDSEDLLLEVSSGKVEEFGEGERIVLIDCGAKGNIVNCLVERGAKVIVVPASTSAEEILKLEPAGVLVSNGPGDPARPAYVRETVKELFGKVPMSGICLGHQIIALAGGAKTYKLKFGHRGANHPVKNLENSRVYITTQNHGFAVDESSLKGTGFEVSQINLNDNTVEGIKHKELPIFSVQYHPEGSPGPRDNEYIFDDFMEMVRDAKKD
jgi:carbamoyl-phosphate synthase small subunit